MDLTKALSILEDVLRSIYNNDDEPIQFGTSLNLNANQLDCISWLHTVREVIQYRNARELITQKCDEYIYYKCPTCGTVHKITYSGGLTRGYEPEYCSVCGQHLNWKNCSSYNWEYKK